MQGNTSDGFDFGFGFGQLSVGGKQLNAAEEAADATTPSLVYFSATTQIYSDGRRGNGIKVSSRTRLENEARISKHLPKTCAQRKIVKLGQHEPSGSNDIFAANFDWVNGITLEEWLRQQQHLPRADLKSRLHVALALAKALSDFHDAGVIHNNISTANVIVDPHKGSNYFSVTLIDLTDSFLMDEEGTGIASIDKDLEQLGRLFHLLFRSEGDEAFEQYHNEPVEETMLEEEGEEARFPDNKRRKRVKSSRAMESMPVYLASMISALTNRCNDDHDGAHRERYEDAKSVLMDLKTAVSKFDVYFRRLDLEEASLLNYLPVPRSAFYGRQAELSILMSSLQSVVKLGKPMMTMVHGHAGTGKTALVKQIKKAIEARNGYLILGKFDMVDRSRPDNVLFEALNTFFGKFVDGADMNAICRMRKRIVGIVRFGIRVLVKSIPNLRKLLGIRKIQPDNEESLNQNQLQNQLLLERSTFFFCKLLQAIADADTPICLVFDDMQWCDRTSLSIIQTIATDPDIQYCLYIGCYRDENQKSLEPIQADIKRIESDIRSLGVNVSSINLTPLPLESVNMLISESICLPPILTTHLSSILHRKTAGSPLFLRSFLSDGMIRFNLTTRRFDYDTRQILMKQIPQETVQYLASRMSQLPQSYRLVLKLASCLGFQFDAATFIKARVKTDNNLEKVLPAVCQIGYIHEISDGKFIWAHDQVMQAASQLIPDEARNQFHMLIGTRILMNTPESELETTIFDILGHMNKAIQLIQFPDQKYEIARLNLMAGESCIRTSSFHSAAGYFMNGIALLPGDCFRCEYQLSLKLHDLAQNALYMVGDFAKMSSLASRVLPNAICFLDKVNSYRNIVGHMICSGKHEEAVSKCASVCREMGQPLPGNDHRKITMGQVIAEYVYLVAKVGFKCEHDFLSLPKMTDKSQLVLMGFLQSIMSTTANLTNPQIGCLVIFRMIRITLKYGLCDISAVAFAWMASFLINSPKRDFSGGCFYANLALKALNHSTRTNKYTAHVHCITYGFIFIWRDPMQASLPKLLEGYRAGCIAGDQEYACWNLLSYGVLALYTGQPLTNLDMKRAMRCQRIATAYCLAPLLSVVLELSGITDNEDIYGSFLNTTEDIILEKQNDRRTCLLIWTKRKFLRVMQNDMDGAIAVYDLSVNHPFGLPLLLRTAPFIMSIYLNGIIAFYAARKDRSENARQKWLDIGMESLNMIKKWVKLSCWNYQSKLLLLEAEHLFQKGDGSALTKYEESIEAARSHRLVHEEGLAYSKLGHYYLSQDQGIDAMKSFAKARQCFQQWGAQALVKRLEDGAYLTAGSECDTSWGSEFI